MQAIVGVGVVELEAVKSQERLMEVVGILSYQKCWKVKYEDSGCLSFGVFDKKNKKNKVWVSEFESY